MKNFVNKYLSFFITLFIVYGCSYYKNCRNFSFSIVGEWGIYEEFRIIEQDTVFIFGPIRGIAFIDESNGVYEDLNGEKTKFKYKLLRVC